MTPAEEAAAAAKAEAEKKAQQDRTDQKQGSQTTDQNKEPELNEFIVDGEVVKLTKDQTARAVYLGLIAAAEKQKLVDGEGDVKKDDLKDVVDKQKGETNKQYDERIAKLEARLEARDRQTSYKEKVNEVQNLINKAEVDEDFKEDLLKSVLLRDAEATSRKLNIPITDLVKNELEKHKKKMEKYTRRVDPEEKDKDRKATEKLTSSNKSAGDKKEEPLKRDAFRSGKLAQRIAGRVKQKLTELTE